MAYDGNGNFNRLYSWTSDRDAAIPIDAPKMDAEMDGFATGLSNAVTKDGQTTVTANLPMNNHKFTGMLAGSATADSARYGQTITSASFNVGDGVLTLTRADGDITVDLDGRYIENFLVAASDTVGTGTVSNGNTLTITGGNGIDATRSGTNVTIAGEAASTSNAGVVQLTDSTGSTSTTTAATPNSVKTVNDQVSTNTSDIALKANLAGPTFSGTVTLPSTTSIGSVSSTEIGYVNGVTSAIQTQLNAKAPTASPTFTGTVTLPSSTSIGSVSSTEIGYINGVTSAIQTQLDAKGDENTSTNGGQDGSEIFIQTSTSRVISVKWGRGTSGGGGLDLTVTFASLGLSNFANNQYAVTTLGSSAFDTNQWMKTGPATTGFTIGQNGTTTIYWIAVGFHSL